MKLKVFQPGKEKYHFYLLIIILAIGFFLRFHDFPYHYGFDFDAARDSLLSAYYVKTLQVPLTGGPSSVAPFYFGPWYYWGTIVFEKIFPIFGSWIFIQLANLACIPIIYKIGKELKNKDLGLILSILFALAPSQVILSTTLSNPSLIPPFALSTILLSLICSRTKSIKNFLFLGFILGIGISVHYQLFGFLIFPLVVLLLANKKFISFLSFSSGFVLAFLPTLIFDLTNNWYNLRGLIFYLTKANESAVAYRWLFYLRDFWPSFWSITLGLSLPLAVLVIIFSAIALFFILKKESNRNYLIILISFLFNFILLRYFPSQKPIYYIYFLQSFIFIFTGLLIYQLMKIEKTKIIGFLLLTLLAYLLIKSNSQVKYTNNSYADFNNAANTLVNKYPNRTYDLFSCEKNFVNGNMAITYLLDKKHLISDKGMSISYEGGVLFQVPKKNCSNISSLSANELKKYAI